MLNFNLIMTEKDRREAAKIEHRRIQEEERKKRIFNSRQRLIGIDRETLMGQIEERKRKDEEEKRLNRIFEDELKRADQVAIACEQKEKNERLKMLQEINIYRKNFQKLEDRREFDLNDPSLIKKQLPARIDDNDPRLSISSAQKFEGEDLVSEQRAKVQRDQIKAWLHQQMQEKEQAERERKAAEDAYKEAVLARDQRAVELEKMEKQCRKRLDEACARFNHALLQERLLEENKKMKQTNDDNMAEIYNTMTSDMFTENPDVSQSNMGPGKIIAYRYKGMTEKEKQQLRNDQMAQIAESKKKRELEARMQREFDEYINGIQKSIFFMDKETEQKQKALNKKLAEENLRLAEEQKSRKQYLEKIVYANRPTPEYFEQFNKSTR